MSAQLDTAIAALQTAASAYVAASQAKDATIATQATQIASLTQQLTDQEAGAVTSINAVTAELTPTPQ